MVIFACARVICWRACSSDIRIPPISTQLPELRDRQVVGIEPNQRTRLANSQQPKSAINAASSEQTKPNTSRSRRAFGSRTATIQPHAPNMAADSRFSTVVGRLDTCKHVTCMGGTSERRWPHDRPGLNRQTRLTSRIAHLISPRCDQQCYQGIQTLARTLLGRSGCRAGSAHGAGTWWVAPAVTSRDDPPTGY